MTPRTLPDGRVPVLVSAHAAELLATDAAALLRYLKHGPTVPEVAAQLLRTRRVRRFRAVVRAADPTELADGLAAVVAGTEHPLVTTSSQASPSALAFVFPGQGGHWPGMGAEAYGALPAYRAEADRCAAAFEAIGAPSPLPSLLESSPPQDSSYAESQGAQFTHAVALARVWQSYGFADDIVIGHSLGEIGAAYIAGAMTLPTAAAVLTARAATMQLVPGVHAVAVLGVPADEANELIATSPGWVELSVVNSRSSVAVSGEHGAVVALVDRLVERGQFARVLSANSPFHTSAFDPLRDAFLASLPRTQFSDPTSRFIGSCTAATTDFGEYWYANLRTTVRFDRAAAAAIDAGARTFVELSTHPALLFALGDTADELLTDGVLTVASGRRDHPLADELSAAIVAVAAADPTYDWTTLVGRDPRPLQNFPNAPMSPVHLWAAPKPLAEPNITVAAEHWEEFATPPAVRRTVALVNLDSDDAAAAALADAIDRSAAITLTDSGRADTLVVIAPALREADPTQATQELAGSISGGLLDYVAAIGDVCRDVWLVTAGGEPVSPTDQILPAQAALAAIHRCLGYEHPDLTFRHLDLPTGALDGALASAAVGVLSSGTTEVALRRNGSGVRLYRRLLDGDPAVALAWPAAGGILDNVLITGGAGVIGMNYARALAERGARRVVLVSRGGADPAALAELAARHGVEVVSVRCDVTDDAQVAEAAAEYACGGASLVIHAAGSAGFADSRTMSGDHLMDIAAAKVGGLAHIVERWPLRPDARIILCSSVSGLWGGKGMIAYSAANRVLDVMAARLRATGLRCVSMRWGLWEGSTLLGPGGTELVQRSGLRPMSPDAAIEASLGDHAADPLVLSTDIDRLRILLGEQDAAVAPTRTATDASDPTSAVRTHLASVLSADASTLDLDMSLFDLGVDSLLAIDLRKRLKQATGQSVPLALLLGGITGTELVDAVAKAGVDQEKVEASRD